jgi:hypothetical protein
MKYQSLVLGCLSIATVSAWTSAAGAATLTHSYGLNNSLADSFGGPSLVANGGTVSASGYSFAANQGPKLSSAISSSNYSILLDYSLADTSSYRKIVDFKNLTTDGGLYNLNSKLNFYTTGDLVNGTTVVGDNTPVRLVLTRDGSTGQTTGFYNGVSQFSFADTGSFATFTGTNNIINFFQDDITTFPREASGGVLQRLAIYDGALSATEVASLGGFGTTIPGTPRGTAVSEPFTIVGTLIGGTAALRMRKKLKSKSL